MWKRCFITNIAKVVGEMSCWLTVWFPIPDRRKGHLHAEAGCAEGDWSGAEQRSWVKAKNWSVWKVGPCLLSSSVWAALTVCASLHGWHLSCAPFSTRTCKLQEEKTKVTEDLLKRRELAVKTMEDTYDQKLQNELARWAKAHFQWHQPCLLQTHYFINASSVLNQ